MNAYQDALRRAGQRDQALASQHDAIRLDPARTVLSQLRAYLIARQDDGHFICRSGARLSFGLTLRGANQHSTLVSYRFDYRRDAAVLRFDLNPAPHANPMTEPRGHLHPGSDSIRVPTPPLAPIEILDILFFAIEPQ